MKRLLTLMLAAGLFFSAGTQQAQAVDVSVSGNVIVSGQVTDGLDFVNSEYTDTHTGMALEDNGFNVRQRFMMNLRFSVSESLSAYISLRAPNNGVWGTTASQLQTGGNVGVIAKHAYLDWVVPNTDVKVRMGLQPFLFPVSFGESNPVMDGAATGISVTAPINDTVTVIGQWFRPETTLNKSKSTLDVFALQVPLKFSGANVTPWAALALGGNQVATRTLAPSLVNSSYKEDFTAYWLGVSSVFTFASPIEFGIDAIYGNVSGSAIDGTPKSNTKNSGWLVDSYLAYNTSYGTPAVFGWYASGDGNYADNKRGGQLPSIASGYGTTGHTLFFDEGTHGILPSAEVSTPAGTWGAGLKFTGFQPMEKTEMGAHVMYVQGTNSKYNTAKPFTPSYLTTKDSLVEIGMYTTYDIYKELQVAFEANYIFQNFDEEIWNINRAAGEKFTNGFRAGVSFKYAY